jgi:hypothetical protein
MTTAGQLLVSRSTLPYGTAMQHFLAQQQGGGITISDGIDFELMDSPFEIDLQMSTVDVELLDVPMVIEAEDRAIEIEIDDEIPVLELDQ